MILKMKAHKFADIFPMMDEVDFNNLKKDIKENGFDNERAILIYEDKILDGRNRFKACKELEIKPTTRNYEGDNPLSYVISNNLDRRHLTPSQRAVIGVEILPLLEEEANRRMSVGGKGVNKLTTLEKGRASEQVAKQFHTNREYITNAKKLKETNPTLFEEVKQGTKDFSDVKKEQRLEKIKKQREELQKETLEKPTGFYDVIVMDVPWNYQDDSVYDADGFRGTCPYPTMSLEEIRNIKLPARDDCVLWFWTTNKHIFYCRDILESWGFELKSILTWDKEHIGIGRWLRSQTEHCILAVKGKPYFNNTTWSTLISEKRTTHSTKPEIFYKMVDEICAGRKLDYFARNKRKGWDVYGDEIK